MEQMNKLHMKYFLLLAAIISYCSAGFGQVTAVQTGNRIDINLDVYDLMDTLQSLRHDITVFQNSQRVRTYKVAESVHTNDAAFELNGYTMLYGLSEVDNENYKIRITGTNLDSIAHADLVVRGEDITGAGYSLTSPPPGWSSSWVQESDSTVLMSIGYSRFATPLNQTDGFISCSLMLDGFNCGMPLLFYLDSTNEPPVLSDFEY